MPIHSLPKALPRQGPKLSQTWLLLISCLACLPPTAGCGSQPGPSLESIRFVDDAQSNAKEVTDLDELQLTRSDGESVFVHELRGSQNMVLIFTRGSVDSICLYCTAQTTRWIRRHSELAKFDAQLAFVFPVENRKAKQKLETFRSKLASELNEKAGGIPFPILLDIDHQAASRLGLKNNASTPATYIMDKRGEIRFAYVGQSARDRPSVSSILSQLQLITAPVSTQPEATNSTGRS